MRKKIEIKEIIVVEGKDDTRKLQEVVNADTIETMGSAINKAILKQIAHANETRGVIIFTDPDYAGEKIRKQVMQAVPNAKHAFLSRKHAVPPKKTGSLGVEHAKNQIILDALLKVVTPVLDGDDYQEISRKTLLDAGLIAGEHAREKRERLGEELRIGYTNSKQLIKRLKMFRITEEQLESAIKHVEESM